MKLIDEKGKLFGIINIIDLAVLVVVLLLVGLVGYKVLGNKIDKAIGTNIGEKEIVFIVKCQGKSPVAITALKQGDQLISDGNYVKAYIESVKSSPAQIPISTADGRSVYAIDPIKIDLMVTIKMKANNGDVIKLGSQDVAITKAFTLKTHTFETGGTIDSIEIK